jgi:hypothetical protein
MLAGRVCPHAHHRQDAAMAKLRTLRITRVPRVLMVLLATTILILCVGALIRRGTSASQLHSDSADLSGFVAVVLPDLGVREQFLAGDADPLVESILAHASLERHEPFVVPGAQAPGITLLSRELAQQPSRPAHLAAHLIALHLDPAAE